MADHFLFRSVKLRATHYILLNRESGTAGEPAGNELRDKFEAHGTRAEVVSPSPGDDLERAARRALADGGKVLVAAGGDGTVNAVAGALIGSGAALAVLPLGTLNHFAKDLGIPADLDGAIEVACRGQVRAVDVGRVDGRVFVNNSSLGLYPQLVRAREGVTQRLGRGKWPAFGWAFWQVMVRYPFLDVRVTVNGSERTYRTPVVFIGNGSYELAGLSLGTRQALDAGHLSVHIVVSAGRLALLGLALRALVGRLNEARDFATFTAKHVEIATRRSTIMVATDGEVSRMPTPLAYESIPGALAVLVPRREG